MKEIISKLKSISQSKNVHEMISRTPGNYIEFLVFFSLLLMLILPLYQLIYTSVFPPAPFFLDSSFGISINTVSMILVMLGVLFLILKHAKNAECGIKLGIKQILQDNIPMVFFGFMMLMMIVSTCINGFTDYAVHGDEYRKESLFTYILYFAVFYFLSTKIKLEKFKGILLYSFIFASIPLAVCVYIDFDIVPLNAFMYKLDFLGIFSNSNHYAYYLTMVILVSAVLYIKEKNAVLKILSMFSFIINTLILIMNNTFGCYLAVFAGLIFNCVVVSLTEKKFNKRTLMLPLIYLLLTFIMSFRFYTFMSNFTAMFSDLSSIIFEEEDAFDAGSGRWKLWVTTAECIAEKPLFGSGVEGVAESLLAVTEGRIDRTHNEFLQYAAFFGIPAGIAYICGAFSVFLNGLKNKFRLDMYSIAALVAAFGYLFSSAFGNTMYYTAPFFFILLGMGFSVNRAEN
ncbi:MAG: O-antigen ligase family protein [Ruminococcus sp.]